MAVKTGLRKEKGNKESARRRGFYASVLDEAEQLDFELAEGIEGIDEEIALLRVKIKDRLANDPQNIWLILKMSETLTRLVKTRYQMDKAHNKGLREAISNVLKDVAFPLGIGIGTAMRK